MPAPPWQRMQALGFAETDEQAREAWGGDHAVGWAQSYSGDAQEAVRNLQEGGRWAGGGRG